MCRGGFLVAARVAATIPVQPSIARYGSAAVELDRVPPEDVLGVGHRAALDDLDERAPVVAVAVALYLDDTVEWPTDEVRGGVANVVSDLDDARADVSADVRPVGVARPGVLVAFVLVGLVLDGIEAFVDRGEGPGSVLVLGLGLADRFEGVRVVDGLEFVAQFVDRVFARVEVSHWWIECSLGWYIKSRTDSGARPDR